jgi:hypothetical protein
VPGQIAQERDAEWRLAQGLTELSNDLSRGVSEPIQDTQDAGTDVLVARVANWRLVSGKPEQVVALVPREM